MKRITLPLLLAFLTAMLALTPLAVRAQNSPLANIPVTEALPGGGTFAGVFTITEFTIENGQLLASGVLTGTATQDGIVTEITQMFTDVAVQNLTGGGQQRRCDILFLDLGPIFLDVLGLEVDLSEIVLDIDAVRGAGNLIGNLLCSLVGLLDGPANENAIQDILNAINRVL